MQKIKKMCFFVFLYAAEPQGRVFARFRRVCKGCRGNRDDDQLCNNCHVKKNTKIEKNTAQVEKSPNGVRAMVVFCKLLQALGNGTELESHRLYSEAFNRFINRHTDTLSDFVKMLADETEITRIKVTQIFSRILF